MSKAFPRGGSLQLAPAKASKSQDEGLFRTHRSEKKANDQVPQKQKSSENEVDKVVREIERRKKKRMEIEGEDDTLSSAAQELRQVHRLKLRELSSDMLVLGIVTSISKASASISLPDGIVGLLSMEELSDEHAEGKPGISENIAEYLKVGDLLPFAIVGVTQREDKKQRVQVSLRASKVNTRASIKALEEKSLVYGSVQSVEDHGYQINLGHKELGHAFVKFSVAGGDVDSPELKIGQFVTAVVTSVKKPSSKGSAQHIVFQLDTTRSTLSKAKTTAQLEVDAIQPGMLVKASVIQCLKDGCLLSFQDMFRGTINAQHLPPDQPIETLRNLKRLPSMEVRVLFINYATKQIGLTAHRWLVHRQDAHVATQKQIGEKLIGRVFKDSVVSRVEGNRCIYLNIPVEDVVPGINVITGCARRSGTDMQNGDVQEMDKMYKVGKRVPCRILNYSPVDGLLYVSVQKNVVRSGAMSVSEMQVAQTMKGTIAKVMENGVVVSLSATASGFVPFNHLSDVVVSDPSSRFKEGQAVECRVLSLDFRDMTKPKVYLTMKRTLVTSTLKPITSFDVPTGTVAHGVVTVSSKEKGLLIGFYNRVQAQVSREDFLALGIEDPAQSYKPGKLVKVRVLKTNPEARRMTVSLRVATGSKEEEASSVGENGSIVAGKVVQKDKVQLVVRLENKAMISIPAVHVADDPDQALALFASDFKKGQKLKEILVLDAEKAIGSLKPALLEANRQGFLPESQSNMTVGSTFVGYVANVSPTVGVFVSFLGDTRGLVPRANTTDGFVADPSEYFRKGQVVLATVCESKDSKRLILSLKPSSLEIQPFMHRCFLASVMRPNKTLNADHNKGTKFANGNIIQGTISTVSNYGVELEFAKGVSGLCLHKHAAESFEGKEGNHVNCRILDISSETGVLDISLRPSLVEAGDISAAEIAKQTKKLRKKDKFLATIELVKTGYVIMSVHGNEGLLAVAPTASFNGKLSDVSGLEIGSRVFVKPTELEPVNGLMVLELETAQEGARKRSRSRGASVDYTSSKREKMELVPGMTVRGRVRNIRGGWINLRLFDVTCSENLPGAENLRGQLHISNAHLNPKALEGKNQSVLEDYNVGDQVEGFVLALEPRVDSNGKHILNVLVVKDKETACTVTRDDVKVGDVYTGFVEEIHSFGLVVSISPQFRGLVYCTNVSQDIDLLEELFNQDSKDRLKVGAVVSVKVLSVSEKDAELTMVF